LRDCFRNDIEGFTKKKKESKEKENCEVEFASEVEKFFSFFVRCSVSFHRNITDEFSPFLRATRA